MGWEYLQPGQGRSCRQPGKLVLPGEVSVSIEPGLKEKELVEALRPLQDERLLMFTDMRQAFGGFTDPKDADRCPLITMPFCKEVLPGLCNTGSQLCAQGTHAAAVPAEFAFERESCSVCWAKTLS